jgi:CBS domain-containing protein
VVDGQEKLIGVIGLPELLSLEMPAFFNLITDLDFVSDFGAVETTRPQPEQVDQPVTELMQPASSVDEECGMLRAYGLMLKHNLSDLPVVSESGQLVGIVSRVDIGAAILSAWKEIGASSP